MTTTWGTGWLVTLIGAIALIGGCVTTTAEADGPARLVIDVRAWGESGPAEFATVHDAPVAQGQIVIVEVAGNDLELSLTAVSAGGVDLTMNRPMTLRDPQAGATLEDQEHRLSLTTHTPAVTMWTPHFDRGSEVRITLHPGAVGPGAESVDQLRIEVRHFGPVQKTNYVTAYEGPVREGQVIPVEITGADLELLVTSIDADGIHLGMNTELAVTDPATGAYPDALQQEVRLSTAYPAANLWTPMLDSGSDLIVTWTPVGTK